MNSEDQNPAKHLACYGAAIASKGFRVFLRHVWKQNAFFKDPSSLAKADTVFDAALQSSDVLFSFTEQRWAELLKRSLRKVARLFVDEGFTASIAAAKDGAVLADGLKAFAPLCTRMDSELQAGFEAATQESDIVVLERLHPHLPPGAWMPPLFADLAIASLWREIAGDSFALKATAESATIFFVKSIKETGMDAVVPTPKSMELSISAFAFASAEIAVSHLKWMLEPASAADLESRLIPFLHKTFSHDSLPHNTTPSNPSQDVLNQPSDVAMKKEKALVPAPQPPLQTPRPVSQTRPELTPIIPPRDDDDDGVEYVERAAVRDVRWMVSGVGIALIAIALLAIFGRGLFEGLGKEGPVDGPEIFRPKTPESDKGRPETIIDGRTAPLADPVAVGATPVVKARLFEQAQSFVESAARAKTSGDNRQCAEDLSRALLLYKQEFGDARWSEQRYNDLRAQYRDQLGLLEFSKEQIDAIEKTLGAQEPDPAEKSEAATEPGLSRMILLFKRGDEEVVNNRPRAAAEAYENGLRLGMEFLGEKHHTDRTYQAHLSHYIDFLISEDLPHDQLQDRLILVKKGRKPGPLPAKKPAPESSGLGLPKL